MCRPYNQGARLTAFELVTEGIPATLIADSAAAPLLASGRCHAVVVGADRVAANGDTANKVRLHCLQIHTRISLPPLLRNNVVLEHVHLARHVAIKCW